MFLICKSLGIKASAKWMNVNIDREGELVEIFNISPHNLNNIHISVINLLCMKKVKATYLLLYWILGIIIFILHFIKPLFFILGLSIVLFYI